MVKYQVRTSEMALMLYGDFTLKNTSNRPIKDFILRCTFSGSSGTLMQKSVTEQILSVIQPGKTKSFSKLVMGFAPRQKADYSCDVMSAEWG